MALEAVQAGSRTSISIEAISSPRISFSADFLDDDNFISINPHSDNDTEDDEEKEENAKKKKDEMMKEKDMARIAEFEFLASKVSSHAMLTADELFFEGKLLPFWQIQHSEKLKQISLKAKDGHGGEHQEEGGEQVTINKDQESKVGWFVDDDPSPRPPKCTVLWKELLRLKKQRPSSLSPSSSSSSTSSSSSSLADIATTAEEAAGKQHKHHHHHHHVKRSKKGLERTRSASIRIRPMISVPICTQIKSSALPPLFPLNLKKGRLDI